MNKQRRARVNKLIDRLTGIRGDLNELEDELQEILDDETEAFDNLPEGLQTDERREPLDNIESAWDFYGDSDSYLGDAIEALECAIDN